MECRAFCGDAGTLGGAGLDARRGTRNEKVVGSIPTGGSTQTPRSETTLRRWEFVVPGLDRLRCPPWCRRRVPQDPRNHLRISPDPSQTDATVWRRS